jgi:hypothetical protein
VPGKLALWTKADSVTHVDEIVMRPLRQTIVASAARASIRWRG